MIVLLDTHALIWSLEDSPQLSATARAIVEDAGNVILASAASAWEITIKRAIGKLAAPDDVEMVVDAVGFTKRSITFADAQRLATLPLHHRDPFDRILIAQASIDGVPIVSKDPIFTHYSVPVIW
jgi:PIN domain nuclease of toxin-antitoxin system